MRAEMAANPRPLLVVHDAREGHLIYDLRLESEDTLELRPMPRPVVQPLHYRPLAVSGGTILGAPLHEFRDSNTGPLIMVAVGDNMVIRMDTVIHDSSTFEALRLLPSGAWHTVPLPRPPIGVMFPSETPSRVSISSYFVIRKRLWICVSYRSTFSFDTEHGTWQLESPTELPFEGRAVFVPELGAAVGLTGEQFLCAYELEENEFHLSGPTEWRDPILSECINAGHQPSNEMVSLAYLGKGRVCVCRGIRVLLERDYPDNGHPTRWYMINSLLVLEIGRWSHGYLSILNRGRLSYHGMWPEGQCRDLYFLT